MGAMRAVILAAGRGQRLQPSGWRDPKCLLPVGGKSLLDNMLDALADNGVRDVVLVVGYRQESLRRHLEGRHGDFDFTCVENPDYPSTSTIHSLWLCRDLLDEDFLYLNGDVYFHPEVVSRLLAEEGNRLAVDGKRCADEEVKVVLDGDARIERLGKMLDPAECDGEFLGIARFAAKGLPPFWKALERHNEELGNRHLIFEVALDEVLDAVPSYAVDVSDLPAVEIDFPADWEVAKRLAREPVS